MLARCFRTVERSLALAAIEAREVTARQRGPVDAVAIHVAAARREPGHRRLVDFGERRLGRIRSGVQPDDCAGKSEHAPPDRSVGRGRNGVERVAVSFVLRWIERLIRFDIRVAFAVAVRVHDQRRPALRLRLVVRFVEHLGVQPAHHLSAAARPQRAVGVVGEHQVMRAEARADVRELFRFRIVDSQMTAGGRERKQLRRRMRRSFLAEGGIFGGTHRRCDPHATLFVEHRIVNVVPARPHDVLAPVG